MVTLSREITSCGGTVNVTTRRSTLIIRVMNGGTRNMPGPLAPVNFPSTKITPRSYCCTTRIAEVRSISTIIITSATMISATMASMELLLYDPSIYIGAESESLSTTGCTCTSKPSTPTIRNSVPESTEMDGSSSTAVQSSPL